MENNFNKIICNVCNEELKQNEINDKKVVNYCKTKNVFFHTYHFLKECNFSQNENGINVICRKKPVFLDKDNIMIRYFCSEHMIIVENTRRKMAERFIKEYEEKLLEYLEDEKQDCECIENDTWHDVILFNHLEKRIKNGDFR